MNYRCPLDELRSLYQRIFYLEAIYKLENFTYKKFKKIFERNERNFEMQKHSMNEDILKYDIFVLTRKGELIKTDQIKSTDDYNHFVFSLHHYILKQHYNRNPQWYEDRGIKQKLILMPIAVHEQLHGQAIRNISDNEFKSRYKISRWDLLFNRKYSYY